MEGRGSMKTTICGLSHEIVMRDPLGRDDTNYGRYDGKMARIHLDKTMPQHVIDTTLVHEWIHGVYEQYGIEHQEIHVSVIAAELYRAGFRVRVEDEN